MSTYQVLVLTIFKTKHFTLAFFRCSTTISMHLFHVLNYVFFQFLQDFREKEIWNVLASLASISDSGNIALQHLGWKQSIYIHKTSVFRWTFRICNCPTSSNFRSLLSLPHVLYIMSLQRVKMSQQNLEVVRL